MTHARITKVLEVERILNYLTLNLKKIISYDTLNTWPLMPYIRAFSEEEVVPSPYRDFLSVASVSALP